MSIEGQQFSPDADTRTRGWIASGRRGRAGTGFAVQKIEATDVLIRWGTEMDMEKDPPRDESAKPVMNYGRPGQVRNGRLASSILATTSLTLTAVAYVFWFIASNEWLMYGEPQIPASLRWCALFALLGGLLLSFISLFSKPSNAPISHLAILASSGTVLWIVGYLIYGLLHLPG